METSQRLLTTRETAALLRVSEKTLRRYADRGLVRRIELNSRVHRYSASSIEALLSDSEVPAANGDLAKTDDAGGGRGQA